jgi:dTDP-4-dehydrorhamnose reductase
MTRVLVLGATGMLGHTVFRFFSSDPALEVWGTARDPRSLRFFSEPHQTRLLTKVDVTDEAALSSAIARVSPDLIINCVGVIKQLASASDPLVVLPINAMLPHRLARLCAGTGTRLIHVSTDCVFSGGAGGYRESDPADTLELYGQSKFIGEVRDAPHVLTVRVSIIGHALQSDANLIDWFLSQEGSVPGYAKAIFSGLPTIELARVFHDYVLPRPELAGLYHVSAAPISKYELLTLVARVYGKTIDIVPTDAVVLDRSLNSERFTAATGYVAPPWPDLVRAMHDSRHI